MSTVTAEISRRPYPMVLAALIAAEATGSFEGGMLIAAIPKLMADFNVTAADISWALTGFFLMFGASAAIGGRLGDLLGRKKVLVVALLLSIIGSLVSIGTGTFIGVVIGRTLQGVSGAVLPLVLGIGREAVEPKRVPVTLSVVAGINVLAGAGGFYVSGLLVEHINWHSIFIVSAVLAAVAALLCAVGLERSPVTRVEGEKFDYIGGVLFVPAICLVLYGVTDSLTRGWGSATVLGTIGIGVVIGAIWVLWELRVENPMLNLRLLSKPPYALTVAIFAFVSFGAIGGMQMVQPILFQSPTSAPLGLGITPSQYGKIGLALAVVGFLFTPLCGRLVTWSGARLPIRLGIAISVVTMPFLYILRDNLFAMILLLVVSGIGVTFILCAIPNVLTEFLPQENMGEAMGVVGVVGSIFSSVGISVFAVVLSSSVVPGTQLPQVSAYGITVALTAAGMVLAMASAFLLPRRSQRGATVAEPESVLAQE